MARGRCGASGHGDWPAPISVFGPCSAIIVGMHEVSLIPRQISFPYRATALLLTGGAA
ncbi:hypothetical protein [Stenotrophomonas sp. PS02298]|uniref:hypothetical protein n=1 Tax=Stenotrophomonas sp. PS02298 TaxID=2991424 RepID=UPI00249A7532|nr:hypothetical protein [Stenotrophomonas sp. PS02298]